MRESFKEEVSSEQRVQRGGTAAGGEEQRGSVWCGGGWLSWQGVGHRVGAPEGCEHPTVPIGRAHLEGGSWGTRHMAGTAFGRASSEVSSQLGSARTGHAWLVGTPLWRSPAGIRPLQPQKVASGQRLVAVQGAALPACSGRGVPPMSTFQGDQVSPWVPPSAAGSHCEKWGFRGPSVLGADPAPGSDLD